VGVRDFLAIAANQRVVIDLLMIGLFAGFYIVPLYALVQTAPRPTTAPASSPATTSSTPSSWWCPH